LPACCNCVAAETHLDHGLTQRGGVADAERRLEVVVGHRHGVEDLRIDLVVLQVDHVHLLADALQRGLRAQRRQIRAHIPGAEHASSANAGNNYTAAGRASLCM
jgi:hypothetical protein